MDEKDKKIARLEELLQSIKDNIDEGEYIDFEDIKEK